MLVVQFVVNPWYQRGAAANALMLLAYSRKNCRKSLAQSFLTSVSMDIILAHILY